MKRKILTILLVLFVASFAMQASAFAMEENPVDEETVNELISPRYNRVSSVENYINYVNGTLYFGVDVLVADRDTLDYVIINAELRTTAGEVIKTFNKRLAYSYGAFSYDRDYVPDHSGLYFLKYTLKCYKDGRLVDTMTQTTKNEYVSIN